MAPKKARDHKRQTKISFSPAAKSSPTAMMGATSSRRATATSTEPSSTKTARESRACSSRAPRSPASDSSSEVELVAKARKGMKLGMSVTTTEHGEFDSSDADGATSETSGDEHLANNIQVKAKLASHKRRRTDSSGESENDVGITVIKTRRKRAKYLESEVSEDEELRVPRSKRRKNTKRKLTSNDDEDELAETQSIPAQERKWKMAKHRPAPEEEEASAPHIKRRTLARCPTTPNDESEQNQGNVDEDEEDSSNNRSDEDDDEEDEDLKADLAFLRSSPLPDRGKLRSAHEKPKTERQKALEALKKRRASTIEPSSSATPARTRRVVLDSDSDSDSELEIIKEEVESGQELDNEEESEEDDISESDRDANALDMFLEDEEDEAFIDNDADAIIGEPILAPTDFMPLILSRMSSSKPRELFKYAIEWMVMKKIHPGFDSKSEIYDITFRKLDDEVIGLANSKFSSSAWTPDFTRVLRARPDLMIIEISRSRKDVMDAHCEACNRRNHPASDELMFTGKPYNKDTLEPLDNDSDSESNDDSDESNTDSEMSVDSEAELNGEKPTYDAQGARLPPEGKTFTVGSTCKANAQVAHTLHHWRYHLYSWVKDYLARENHLTAEKLVRRDGWSDKKREKAALKIVKHMEAVGEVMKLYKLYKDQMSYAAEVRHDLNRNYRGRG